MSRIIDGRAIAAAIAQQTAQRVGQLAERGITPVLAVVAPTRDEGAAWYLRSIERAAGKAGIICQAPLPAGVDAAAVGASIAVAKDVDGANPTSLGLIAAGVPTGFAPATAAAVLEILHREQVPLSGQRAVVVGRSVVVGKPTALLLLAEHATVTVCHSRTRDLAAVCREADIIVAAAGRAGLIGASHVAPGAVVIDVGISPAADGGMVGDVDLAAVRPAAAAVTPVPGGVGPVTTAVLLQQTVRAALAAS
jgi:methylenetetrahydrofolate dehydrogenase (NADP+)/methenyltetrahydrofolate cyclohydrolase